MKKTILITGSTDGIGKQTALLLANEGHKILIHGRNDQKVKVTVAEISKKSGNLDIQGFVADLSEFDSVKKLAEDIKQNISTLDILINNAGVYNGSSTGKDGYDLRFTVNYFAPYILTNALIPLFEDSQDARIINLSSAAQSVVNIEALQGKKSISVGEGYAQSKLALTMWSFYLADLVKYATVIPVNPGSLLNTKMVKEAFGQHWAPVDKGADILYHLATNEKVKEFSGKYFDNDSGSFTYAHPSAYNKNAIEQLISVTEEIVSK